MTVTITTNIYPSMRMDAEYWKYLRSIFTNK